MNTALWIDQRVLGVVFLVTRFDLTIFHRRVRCVRSAELPLPSLDVPTEQVRFERRPRSSSPNEATQLPRVGPRSNS